MQQSFSDWHSARLELKNVKNEFAAKKALLDEEVDTARSIMSGMLERLQVDEVQTMSGDVLVLVKNCVNNSKRAINAALLQDAVAQCTREDVQRSLVACEAQGGEIAACVVLERALLHIIKDVGNVQTQSLKITTPKVQNAEKDKFYELTKDETKAVSEFLRLQKMRKESQLRFTAASAPILSRIEAAEKLLLIDLRQRSRTVPVYIAESGMFRKHFLKLKTKTSKSSFGVKVLEQEQIVRKAIAKVLSDADSKCTIDHLSQIQDVQKAQLFSEITTSMIEDCRLKDAVESTVVTLNRGHLTSRDDIDNDDASASIILETVN